jgi:hypothetical protein
MNEVHGKRIYGIEKWFSVFVCTLPITQYYKSPIPVFNLATCLSLLFFIYFLCKQKFIIYRTSVTSTAYIFAAFITINVILTFIIYNRSVQFSPLMEFLRLLLLVGSLLILGGRYFRRDYALHVLEIILIASACFMVVQFICYYALHRPITGNIPFLVTNVGYRTARERPTGFYMEPAAYAQSAIMFLCFKLFGKTKIAKPEIVRMCIIIAGILLSGSGQGYMFLALVLTMWIMYRTFFSPISSHNALKGLVIIGCIFIVLSLVLRSSYGQYVLSRIVNEESDGVLRSIGGSALSGRTYTNRFFDMLSNQQKWLGLGFGHGNEVLNGYYVNSLYYYLIECGYLSIAAWGLIVFSILKRAELPVKAFLIIYVIMFYFTGCAKSMMFCYYALFMLAGDLATERWEESG